MHEEIQITRWAVGLAFPEIEQHGALKDKPLADAAPPKAVQEAFDTVPPEYILQFLTSSLCEVEESLSD